MELTVEDIALRLRCHVRTARRWCDAWIGAQARAGVPRVELRRSGRRGRPRYVIEGASFELWQLAANTDCAAND